MDDLQHPLPEIMSGVSCALFALVRALDSKGLMRYDDYRIILREYHNQMPKDDAVGGIGFVFEQLIELLGEASVQNK
jgi:hypothetical protein